MNNVTDLSAARFLTPEEVAELFRRSVPWVYNNCMPAKGRRRAGFLFPAARRFGPKSLLFDRAEVERIIQSVETSTRPTR